MKNTSIHNIEDLTESLCRVYDRVQDTDKSDGEAMRKFEALTNVTGKIINAQKMQIAYAMARKEAPHIPFMENGPGLKIGK